MHRCAALSPTPRRDNARCDNILSTNRFRNAVIYRAFAVNGITADCYFFHIENVKNLHDFEQK